MHHGHPMSIPNIGCRDWLQLHTTFSSIASSILRSIRTNAAVRISVFNSLSTPRHQRLVHCGRVLSTSVSLNALFLFCNHSNNSRSPPRVREHPAPRALFLLKIAWRIWYRPIRQLKALLTSRGRHSFGQNIFQNRWRENFAIKLKPSLKHPQNAHSRAPRPRHNNFNGVVAFSFHHNIGSIFGRLPWIPPRDRKRRHIIPCLVHSGKPVTHIPKPAAMRVSRHQMTFRTRSR